MDTGRDHLGNTTIDEPLDNDLRTYEGELEVEFSSRALFDLYDDGTMADLVFSLDNGVDSLIFTTRARLDGGTPSVGGRDLVVVSYPFVCVGTTDAAAITAVLTTADATP